MTNKMLLKIREAESKDTEAIRGLVEYLMEVEEVKTP